MVLANNLIPHSLAHLKLKIHSINTNQMEQTNTNVELNTGIE